MCASLLSFITLLLGCTHDAYAVNPWRPVHHVLMNRDGVSHGQGQHDGENYQQAHANGYNTHLGEYSKHDVRREYGAPASGYSSPSNEYSAPISGYNEPLSSYDAPSRGHSSPPSVYGSPSNEYDAPSRGYSSPTSGYDEPQSSYVAHSSGYSSPSREYSAPSSGYSSPSSGYGEPSSGYSSPSSGYSSPSIGYSSPSGGYGAPTSGYDEPSASGYSPPASGYGAPDESYNSPSTGYGYESYPSAATYYPAYEEHKYVTTDSASFPGWVLPAIAAVCGLGLIFPTMVTIPVKRRRRRREASTMTDGKELQILKDFLTVFENQVQQFNIKN